VIVVCGEALIDMIYNGDGTQRAAPGGGPFNTARALARLGVPTAFLGHLSRDKFGRELADLLVADGASLEMATIGAEPTTIALADVGSEGFAEYQFLIQGTSAPNLTLEMLPLQLPPEVNALHVGTLGLVLEPMASTVVELVRREREGRLIMLDPNIRVGIVDEAEYRDRMLTLVSESTVVKASNTDLAWLYPDGDHEAAVDQIRKQCGRDRRVLGRALPEPERDLHALGRDPERDDVRPAFHFDPVQHQHRQPDVIEATGHQLGERLAGALDERARDR